MNRRLLSKAPLLVGILGACAITFGCGGGGPSQSIQGSVAPTQNPLVAQYTIVSACQGPAMIEFGPDTNYGRSTAGYPLPGNYRPYSIPVAGMRPSTTYHMRADVQCNNETFTSADTTFTTGALPSSLAFPAMTVTRPNPSTTSPENPGIESVTVPFAGTPAFYTDRDANPIWYYDVGQGNFPFTFKLLPDGNVILSITTPATSILREVDLTGKTVREMSIGDLQQKMQAAGGFDFVPGGYHHDVLPLSNGHVLVIVDCWQYLNVTGYPGTTQVQGDAIVDLDQNWNPVWAWNSFDYLDVNRHLQSDLANGVLDWTHSNALVYSASDGNLILSLRHQSWVLKINYSNGTGSGNIIWKLGYQGDFALTQNGVPTDDPSLWFSFQHYPNILSQNGAQTELAIWDNGDNRVLDTSGAICFNPQIGTPPCYSRATIFSVDESAMVANLEWADVQTPYSIWGGSINRLENGNVEFDLNAPILPPVAGLASQVSEVTQADSPQTVWQMDIPLPFFAYRAYRVPSLYNGVTWQY